MTTENREATCAERLPRHRDGRVDDFRTLAALGQVDGADLIELVAEGSELIEKGRALGVDLPGPEDDFDPAHAERVADDVRESAERVMDEYPLGLSASRVFRVDLSTGGPGDWLEVHCSGDTPRYEAGGEPYEVERIVYHFNDWFDHAEQPLEGDDFANALAFLSRIVPELVE